ncbi:MAG TPA: polyprenyl synthetase family protein [Chloroflexia bacterium]|nr:polyprenyl synthetase family protein [Chloroflexia bacterium]
MTQAEKITSTLSRYAAAIDRQIVNELETELDPWLRNAIMYHFGWLDQEFRPVEGGNSGKKLRPVMALLAYQGALDSLEPGSGLQAELAPALPLAACLEMIHNYSLIHDDIEDDDRTRRGRPTLWALFGKPKAINAGDCLDMLAYRALLRSAEHGLDPSRLVQIARTVTDTSVKLTVGQNSDMSFEESLDVTPEMYLQMISGKTAALISCATYCGALVALDPSNPLQVERLNDYAVFGEQIGLGFQIRDDILGIWGLAADTGKPSGSDIRRRKKSLPALYALTNAPAAGREKLLALYRSSDPVTPDQEQFVMEMLEESGARAYCQQQADHYKQTALQALEKAAGGAQALAQNAPLAQLRDLCTFLVERDY